MLPVVKQLMASWIYNEHWSEGMSTSLAVGVAEALKLYPEIKGVLVMLIDQPLIIESHYKALVPGHHEMEKVVATHYPHGPGVPAFIPRSLFTQVSEIKGDKGARELFRNLGQGIELVECEQSLTDIDTQEDWQKFLSENG